MRKNRGIAKLTLILTVIWILLLIILGLCVFDKKNNPNKNKFDFNSINEVNNKTNSSNKNNKSNTENVSTNNNEPPLDEPLVGNTTNIENTTAETNQNTTDTTNKHKTQ